MNAREQAAFDAMRDALSSIGNVEDMGDGIATVDIDYDKASKALALSDKVVEQANCPTCQLGGMMPPHFASPRCESGRRNHCSCDTCF